MYKKKKLPERTVVITFDDGYESSYVYAFPILKKYNHHVVLFTVTSTIVNEESHSLRQAIHFVLCPNEGNGDSGLIEFGSYL